MSFQIKRENNTEIFMKIGILYVCTGKYTVFWKEFYETCEKFLLPSDEKYYFVFTDAEGIDYEKDNPRITKIKQPNLGWPDNTLKRYHIFVREEKKYEKMDYLYFFNGNLKLLKTIEREEFLPQDGNIMLTVHPGFYNKKNIEFPYDRNKKSTAYIPIGEGDYYFAGGLNGAKTKLFLEMAKKIMECIDRDEDNNYVAIWHDESQINAYAYHHHNYQLLSPSYLYPEGWRMPFDPIILIRDKSNYGGHEQLRDGTLAEFCENKRYLYIYGAEKKGKEIRDKLTLQGIQVKNFVVSDDQEIIDNEGTIHFSQMNTNPDETGIIIALKHEYQGTIKLICKKRGYSNVFLAF